jgi:hypothetical protein
MSEENVELTYQLIELFNRRDLGEFLKVTAKDVRADPLLAGIEGGYRGHDGIRRWWKTLLDSAPDITVEVIEVREYGDDWVLSVVRLRGHGGERRALRRADLVRRTYPAETMRLVGELPDRSRGPRGRRAVGVGREP